MSNNKRQENTECTDSYVRSPFVLHSARCSQSESDAEIVGHYYPMRSAPTVSCPFRCEQAGQHKLPERSITVMHGPARHGASRQHHLHGAARHGTARPNSTARSLTILSTYRQGLGTFNVPGTLHTVVSRRDRRSQRATCSPLPVLTQQGMVGRLAEHRSASMFASKLVAQG
jgi:hypothetical protein